MDTKMISMCFSIEPLLVIIRSNFKMEKMRRHLLTQLLQKEALLLDVVAHTFNTSTQEAETETQGQRGVYCELQISQGYMVRPLSPSQKKYQ